MNSDVKRLEWFRQFRSEVRGSNDYLVIGIDVAKEKHHAFFGTSGGTTLYKRFVFANTREGFERLRELARDLQQRHGLSERVFGLEPTGVYHKPLLAYLIERGECVVQVSNVAVQRNRELLDGRWDKNDAADTANVADLVGQGRVLFPDAPGEPLRELRNLVRARVRLKKREHALRMRIRNHLVAQFFPELERAYGRGIADQVVLQVVRHGMDPREIAQMAFEAFWNRIALPRWNIRQERKVREVWEAAKTSIGCPMDETIRWEAQRIVEELELVRTHLVEVEKRMRESLLGFPEARSLLSIPGVGPVLAAMVLAAIGDPHRFQHRRQVVRLAGLDLCASRSGKTSDRAVPKISKQGKGALRYALVHAAIIAAHQNPAIRAYFTRCLEGRQHERGIRQKMYVKLAAKLLVVAWHLMKTRSVFDPELFLAGQTG